MQSLGVTWQELDIRPAAQRMLSDIGHPFAQGQPIYDLTFENVQAGLRTDYLFRLANHHNGIVVGTGDLSELALGWCTYGVGDQMAHYNVNAGVPKTLIQHLIRWVISSRQFDAGCRGDAGRDPRHRDHAGTGADEGRRDAAEHGGLSSAPMLCRTSTSTTRCATAWCRRRSRSSRCMPGATRRKATWPPGFPPDRRGAYDLATIRKWLEVFLRRFFAFSQFKRSAMPNGPKVSAGGSLSPRGDWRAPSDGNANAWLAELERNVPPGPTTGP